MPSGQKLARFYDGSQTDFYKCAFLFEKIEIEEKKFPQKPEKARSANKIRTLKRQVEAKDYSKFGQTVSLAEAETFAKENRLRIRIWKQKNYKSKLFLEYESPLSDDTTFEYRNFDIFSRTFDKYKNVDFTGVALVLDIQTFVNKRDYDPSNDRIPKRQMTIFQAIVTELFPKLHGANFNKKVESFEKKWGNQTVDLKESRRLHDLFGIGIQVWTRFVKSPNVARNTQCRRLFDTFYKKKVRIEVEDLSEHEPIHIKTLVWYIFDETVLNYFACTNKRCHFGTNRYQQLQKHILTCRNETLIEYKQKRKAKPDDKIVQELVREKILPSADFHNTFYAVFDIGKSN